MAKSHLHEPVIESYKVVLHSSSTNRHCVGLPEAIAEGIAYFESLPSEFTISFFLDQTPQKIGQHAAEAISNAVREATNWLRFVHRSTAYRAEHLVNQFVRGLNDRSYLAAVLCARALLELAALFDFQLKSLLEHVARLMAIAPEELRGFTALQETRRREIASSVIQALSAIRLTAAKTRFNWLAAKPFGQGNLAEKYSEKNLPDELRQDHVLKAIDKMRMVGPCQEKSTMRFYYEMICDFVHPNVGSVAVFIDEAGPESSNRFRYTVRRQCQSSEVVQVVLSVTSIPVREALTALLTDLKKLDQVTEQLADRNIT
jgi:hypothetical protein